MFSLFLVILVCIGYYYLNKFYPRDTKEQIYFGICMSVWIVIIYFMNFQEQFMYRMFKQIYDIQKKPLYDINDFMKKEESNRSNDFNMILLQNQGSRCGKCKNFILPNDIKYTSLNYRIPLHQGGSHDHNNLMVVCPNCNHTFY
tara:strand:+ start:416 stop:847 length:432 start_codon:yes stop_codon:yes gene_type:complete